MPTWLAITVGSDIFSWRPLDRFELAHELTHVQQWRAHGVRFVWRYLAASRAAQRSGRDRYRNNRYEEQALAVEQALRERVAGPCVTRLPGPGAA
jgi:hypothetical protein